MEPPPLNKNMHRFRVHYITQVDKLYHFEYLIKVQDTTLVNVRYMYEWFQDRRFSYGGACVEGKVSGFVTYSLL